MCKPGTSRASVLSRRATLTAIGGWSASAWLSSLDAAEAAVPRSGLGLVIYVCSIRRGQMLKRDPQRDLFAPATFLRHCHAIGAGGMQAKLGNLSAKEIDQLRAFADRHDLFIDAIVTLPQDEDDIGRFESEIRVAHDVGVLAARTTIIPGRRYEQFQTLEEFRTFQQRGHRMLERSVPVVERFRVPLAVENHKDERIEERVGLLERIGSEYVGACVDTGNSVALLDDPYQTVAALAPFAFTVHLKDQSLQPYDDGFLLGDIPLGQGSLDLKQMVDVLRTERPEVRFVLELITRDALKVPCLTDPYWVTLPDVPGRDLARILQLARTHRAEVQYISRLTPAEQLKIEDANVADSLRYGREELHL